MRIERLGDAAFILRDLDFGAHLVARAIRDARHEAVLDAWASYETVGVAVKVELPDDGGFMRWVESLEIHDSSSKAHVIPVCYEMGPDLASAADALATTPEEIVRAHLAVEYKCFAVGFCPGFAYLGWLEPGISGVPRLSTPRVRVEPGSVGITGRQTGVYPLPSPGGWNLIGRTPLTLVDVTDSYFPIEAGDTVSFTRIDGAEFSRLEGERL